MAFVAYVVGLRALAAARVRRAAVVAIAVAIQLVPLATGPILSSDVYTYWVYGDIANPYRDTPDEVPEVAGFDEMGEKWRDQTTVYGPAFTFASRPAAGGYVFKLAAAVAMVAVVLLAARWSTFAAAFAGWNPVLAVHAVGGGHNDAWMVALVLGALALAASGRRNASGAAWALATLVKWVPLVLLPLQLLAERRRFGVAGFALTAAVVGVLATWRFGGDWLGAVAPIAENASETTSFSVPHRLSQLGIPESVTIGLGVAAFAAAYLWLAREALRGRARLALAMGIFLLCVPYVTPWYLAWVVPLAAIEDDRTARVLALGLTAYLLPQTIPV